MAELVDALASGASVRKYVKVQVLSSAPRIDFFTIRKSPMLRVIFNVISSYFRGYMTSSHKKECRSHSSYIRKASCPSVAQSSVPGFPGTR